MPISTKSNMQEDSRICKIYLETSEPHDEPLERHLNGESALKKSFSSSVNTMLARRHSWSKKDSIDLHDSTRKIRLENYITEKLDLNTELAIDIKKTMSQGIICTKSPWDILCKLLNCKVAFKKQHNGKKYNWIQLAGHAGRFIPGDREGFILKLLDHSERKCLETLQTDFLSPFVPKIDKIVLNSLDKKHYMELEDLLYSFHNPSIMDIKIGTRTFLENDGDEKESKPRHDLYLKLIEMAPGEPTEVEHLAKAITKKRYMSWRERSSCSSNLGFRIEAIKKNQVSEREFYTVKEKREVLAHIRNYTSNKKNIMGMYLRRLIELYNALKSSSFFESHEMIGSSLLFVHDANVASIWMIDFGKTRQLPPDIQIDHMSKWIEGNHEDGYLFGIENLMDIFQEAIST